MTFELFKHTNLRPSTSSNAFHKLIYARWYGAS